MIVGGWQQQEMPGLRSSEDGKDVTGYEQCIESATAS
jgi:hypothetical protein